MTRGRKTQKTDTKFVFDWYGKELDPTPFRALRLMTDNPQRSLFVQCLEKGYTVEIMEVEDGEKI